jgi:hypothetical protein
LHGAYTTECLIFKSGYYGPNYSRNESEQLDLAIHAAEQRITVRAPNKFTIKTPEHTDGSVISAKELLKTLGNQNQEKTLIVYFYSTREDYGWPGIPPKRLARCQKHWRASRETVAKLGYKRVIWIIEPAMQLALYVLEDTDESILSRLR